VGPGLYVVSSNNPTLTKTRIPIGVGGCAPEVNLQRHKVAPRLRKVEPYFHSAVHDHVVVATTVTNGLNQLFT
jgi:hypothetical protein